MGFVVYKGEIDYGDFDCDLIASDGLIRGRGNKGEGRNTQGQGGSNQKGRKHKYKYDIFKL